MAQSITNDVRVRGLKLLPEWDKIKEQAKEEGMSQADFLAHMYRRLYEPGQQEGRFKSSVPQAAAPKKIKDFWEEF